MTFAEFCALPDLDKIVLVEIKAGREVEGETWTATGSGSWWCSFSPSENGEVVSVKENGSAYTKKTSIALCDAAASSFFFDFAAERLYVHTSGNDAPDTKVTGAYKYCLIAYFWICVTNKQEEGHETIYAPQDAVNKVYYLPYLDPQGISTISQGVGDYYVGNVSVQFGGIRFLNDGWWYEKKPLWILDNKIIYVKIGAKDSTYAEFETIFLGKVRNHSISDDSATLEVEDDRIARLRQIPTTDFWISNYANLESGAEGQVIPILFGHVHGITPICISTTTFKYKICAYAIEAVEAVYKNEVALTPTTHYTTDLPNGEFTLTADPGDAVITCDGRGIKCDMITGLYSTNVADFLYFVLVTLNGIAAGDIDPTSFADLKAARTQELGWYLNSPMETLDFIRLLQASSVFHYIPLLNGKHGAYRYASGTTGSEPKFYDEDCSSLTINYLTSSIFKRVKTRYGYNPSTGKWLVALKSENKVSYRYDEEGTLTIDTALNVKADAETLAQLYLDMAKATPKKISGSVSTLAANMKPTDKSFFTKTVISAENERIKVLDAEVLRILELSKNIETAKVEVMALNDLQSYGGYHNDAAHTDSHSDEHGDSTHEDTPHYDYSYEDHSDTAHADNHSDVAHADSHGDDPHMDLHDDHEDSGYDDHHTDEAYVDTHGDTAHEDSHGDTTHVDHQDDWYTDIDHTDSIHSDYHYDQHSDTPHLDSDY